MSVILIARQVTGEHSKGYIKGISGGSSRSGTFGSKGLGVSHFPKDKRRYMNNATRTAKLASSLNRHALVKSNAGS